jgi:hypothetical protein
MTRTLISALAGLLLATATAAHAQSPQAGADSIAYHRETVRLLGAAYGTGIAAGIVSTSNALGIRCERPKTVGELEAFLLYRADPTWSVQDAIRAYWLDGSCRSELAPAREKTKL